MTVRKANLSELPLIMDIYATARRYMAEHGNPTQWGSVKPTEAEIRGAIEEGILYALELEGQIEGVFSVQPGPDPTYGYIEDGAWPNDRPYHVVHRIASAGRARGVFHHLITWCYEQFGTLRIDTHANNATMHHLVAQHGFTRCGIIYIADGTQRIAYQKD